MKISPPGRMIDVGGRSMHVHASGKGTPIVVLEAGIAASSVSWSMVQERVSRTTTVVSYDRAGFGFSDAGTGSSATARDAALDLVLTLACSGLTGPYILVGHSYGALI